MRDARARMKRAQVPMKRAQRRGSRADAGHVHVFGSRKRRTEGFNARGFAS
jgi:hypothetical protein